MGGTQCDACREYYRPSKMQKFEFDLSQSSYFPKYKNPFFKNNNNFLDMLSDNSNKVSFNDISEKEKDLKDENDINNKKEEVVEEEEKEIKNENDINNKKVEEEKKIEDEELNKLKNQILEQEKENRMKSISNNPESNINSINNNNEINNSENSFIIQKEKEVNKKINQTLENMCILGSITKKELREEKEKNPEKFIETSETLKMEDKDRGFFALGLLSQNLEDIGIETAIEKETNDDEQDASATCLQFIANGLAQKKKYDLHFDFGEERNEELIKNNIEFENFKKDLKKKLSKDYHIPEDKIIVTFPQKGSFHVQVIFQSQEFNDLNLEEFKEKFENDDEFKDLAYLKEIHSDVIMGACKLSKKQLDERGNNIDNWAIGENRGGRPYNSPEGWIGIGLKVMDKYENNIWIGCTGSPGEWCVAYHGVGRFLESEEVKGVTGKIIKGAFKAGKNQVHKNCENLNKPGTKVGEGVYCTPNVDTAAWYAGTSEINGKSYKTVLMVRVKPEAIRECSDSGDYWVVNGTTDEIRPYRILYKCE